VYDFQALTGATRFTSFGEITKWRWSCIRHAAWQTASVKSPPSTMVLNVTAASFGLENRARRSAVQMVIKKTAAGSL
jgi:hypothetical protein